MNAMVYSITGRRIGGWSTNEGVIYVYTRRKVSVGEELCINYGEGYWKNGWKKV